MNLIKRILFPYSIIILPFILSCLFKPDDDGNNNNNGNDTIIGWKNAGIISTGQDGQHVDVCHYNEYIFTFNYRGELFGCTYPELAWSQMSVPNGNKIYCYCCDTINGLLYISTVECGVYEYSIKTKIWRSLLLTKNILYDSTKMFNDSILSIHLYNIICHKDKIYIMTAQRWTENKQTWFAVSFWKSNRDTLWEKADSGWVSNPHYANTITDFYSIDDYLYASTFENGLWRYDGISWMAIPGTRQEDVYFLDTSGGDTRTIPGFRPRSMVKHNNDIYVGNLGGMVHKMRPGFNWEKKNLVFFDYGFNDTMDMGNPVMCLYSFNGYIARGTYYFNESANLWYNMTPMFKAIDTNYNNGLPGSVYGMTNIGDTLFAALGNNEGLHSGVYFLDLKKCKWYQKYH